jgi:hypothetical protein
MCNLCSITTNKAAISALFRAWRREIMTLTLGYVWADGRCSDGRDQTVYDTDRTKPLDLDREGYL